MQSAVCPGSYVGIVRGGNDDADERERQREISCQLTR